MTKKERVKRAINHQEADIVPYSIGFTIPAYEKINKYYNGLDVWAIIGNHVAGAGSDLAFKEIKPGFWQDEWGVVWDKTMDKDIGNVCNHVIEDQGSLDKYVFPKPDRHERFDFLNQLVEANKDDFILYSIGFSLFERAWTLRGMENFLIDMVTDEGFVNSLLDRILEFNLGVIEKAVKFPIDCMHFGDDWGQQNGLIMGPALWRKFIKPRVAKIYKKVHDAGLPVSIHSCGDVKEIFPDLIEIGLNSFNPFQPEVMDVYEMKKKYGDKLCFWGGLSTQKTLPFGTPDDVRKEAKRLMKEIGADGGYILAPAHAVPKDVPVENIVALIETVSKQK